MPESEIIEKKLEINIADLTKLSPIVAQLLLDFPPDRKSPPICKGDRIDDCWITVAGSAERIDSLKEILSKKDIRVK